MDKRNRLKICVVLIFSTVLSLNVNFIIENCYQKTPNKSQNDFNSKGFQNEELNNQGIVQDYYTKEWLNNSNFDSQNSWFSVEEGDTSDVSGYIDSGQANLEILGEKHTFSLIADPPTASNWTEMDNPEFPNRPDSYGISNDGCRVSHEYDDQTAVQNPSVHWEKNVTMPIDMSDYIITSASIQAIVNATVDDNLDRYYDYVYNRRARVDPTQYVDTYGVGDYIKFYILISDLEKNKKYEIAYFQTESIGSGSPPGKDILDDTYMLIYSEEDLIFFLTSVLSSDNYNFTVTIGIRLNIEDNCLYQWDLDNFDEIIINFVNLTFIYEKKIDQFTAISWNQVGNKLEGSSIDITNATLNFKYKVDRNWPTSSPNSEIRVYINNRIHPETVKLSNAKSTFQDIKIGGFDVKNLILIEENISVSIQVYIADPFTLNQTITISIDNASLFISYIDNIVEAKTRLDLFLESTNKTLEKSIEATMGNFVNITAIYKDNLNEFIQNAIVQLKGLGSPKNLTENGILEQYNITIQTSNLKLGNNFLILSASKKYYESVEIQINIKVIERETDLQLFLDKHDKTLDKSIQMFYGNSGNITITYKDKELDPNVHISGASVELTELGTPKNLIEDILLEQYTVIIDTKDLGLGFTYLIVNAQKENYSFQSIQFKIEVLERESYINKTFLNQIESTELSIQWNETLTIEITYYDNMTKNFISNALVQLLGVGISKNFTENNPLNYSLCCSTGDLKLGLNFLTISAQKENYTLSTKIITISVLERTSYLDISLNNINSTKDKSIGLSIGNILNVTIRHIEISCHNTIKNSMIQIVSEQFSENLTYNQYFDHYTILINTSDLGIGIKIFTIITEKPKFQTLSLDLRISVERIKSEIITLSGEPKTEIEVGSQAKLEICLLNSETNDTIKGAIVEYSWEFGIGILVDNNNDGIYEVLLQERDVGSYTITITAHAGDNYDFTSYELSLIVIELAPIIPETLTILWVILLILSVIIGVLGALSLRTYVIMPRKLKTRNALLLRTQRFKDVENIQGVLLIHTTSGLPLFSKNYSNLMEGKNTLFSGFIQAISLVSQEISYKKQAKTKLNPRSTPEGIPQVVELDFKHFLCIMLDVEELRTVLILKHKSSKRLKTQLLNFSLTTYVKFSEALKNWDNDLSMFNKELPPFLENYFNLIYKNNFELTMNRSDFEEIRKETNFSRNVSKIMNVIFPLIEAEHTFKLIDLLEKAGDMDEDLIIDSIEELIKHQILIPIN